MIPYESLKPLNEPYTAEFKQVFDAFLDKGYYILGNVLEQFEQDFAAYHSLRYAVGVSNGLDAITLSLKASNLPEGSEVLVPSNTYIATILAVLHAGLKPVMVEPDIRTYNIDPVKIEAAITPRTKAMAVVHLYGRCCEMDEILKIKDKYNLILIEDCAQAHGATYKGKLAGTFGEFGAFSFYPTKNLGALGDAGGIICSNEADREMLLHLRNYGSIRKYYNDVIGYNCRLDELQAGFLRVKLKYLDQINAHKNRLAQLYHQHLSDQYILPLSDDEHYHVYHIFNIRHPQRDKLQQYLAERGIGTVIHYPVPPHRQLALKDIFAGRSFPISDEIHQTTLSLPCSPCHSEEDIMQVVEALNNF